MEICSYTVWRYKNTLLWEMFCKTFCCNGNTEPFHGSTAHMLYVFSSSSTYSCCVMNVSFGDIQDLRYEKSRKLMPLSNVEEWGNVIAFGRTKNEENCLKLIHTSRCFKKQPVQVMSSHRMQQFSYLNYVQIRTTNPRIRHLYEDVTGRRDFGHGDFCEGQLPFAGVESHSFHVVRMITWTE